MADLRWASEHSPFEQFPDDLQTLLLYEINIKNWFLNPSFDYPETLQLRNAWKIFE